MPLLSWGRRHLSGPPALQGDGESWGTLWGQMGDHGGGEEMRALMASLPTAVGLQGMVPCWEEQLLPQPILPQGPSPQG